MHLKPAEGNPRPVGRAIVDHLFPDGDSGRIPIVGISGSQGNDRHRASGRPADYVHRQAHRPGLPRRPVSRARARSTGRTAQLARCGRKLLMNRGVEAAVFEHDATSILGEGYAYDRCQVGVVTDLQMRRIAGRVLHPRTRADAHRDAYPGGRGPVRGRGGAAMPPTRLVAELASLCDGRCPVLSRSIPICRSSPRTAHGAGGRCSCATSRWSSRAGPTSGRSST